MAGMLELPVLPLGATQGREPVLRLRHAITNTNYYVEIFSEGVKKSGEMDPSLMEKILASKADLRWLATSKLTQQPLTGLARKVLQRLSLMAVPRVTIEL